MALYTPYMGLTPTRTLRPRDEAASLTASYATGSDGCAICTAISSCPTCPLGQECNLKGRTCSTCPEYVCVAVADSLGSTTPIGGIVGGVVGGVVVLAAVLVLYYFLVYRKKHPQLPENGELGDSYTLDRFGEAGSSEKADRPLLARTHLSLLVVKNRRMLSYDSFMRPPRPRAQKEPRKGPYMDNNAEKRQSVATTISITNASNILPIAYIPGVTMRPTHNNSLSIYLYDLDSVLLGLTGIDNALIVQDRPNAPVKGTMTAIRAQPKLVNVDRIEEEDEDDHASEHDDDASHSHWGDPDSPFGDNSRVPDSSSDDAELDSDVDSDIGEIHRATVDMSGDAVRTNSAGIITHVPGLGAPVMPVLRDDGLGSFVLDIARDD